MRSLLTALLPWLSLGLMAQQQVQIIAPEALIGAHAVRKDKAAQKAMEVAGFGAEETDLVLQYGDPDQWPSGIRTLDSVKANAPYVANYTGYRLCAFQGDSAMMALVMIPAKDNLHMPAGMRPLADFYLILPETALKATGRQKPRPEIGRGPLWKKHPKVKILKPDGLYATYDLASDSMGMKALADAGMSTTEMDAVVFRSVERNWPEGINNFTDRATRLERFKKYHAFLGARWDDKVLVIVPVEKNRRMPVAMRPFVDLYFVYTAASVKVAGKSK